MVGFVPGNLLKMSWMYCVIAVAHAHGLRRRDGARKRIWTTLQRWQWRKRWSLESDDAGRFRRRHERRGRRFDYRLKSQPDRNDPGHESYFVT